MTYGEYKKYILMKLDEYSGDLAEMTDDSELAEKLPYAINEAMRFVFYGKNITRLWHFVQGESFNAVKPQCVTEHRNEDIEFSTDDAYGYYFEVDDKAEVKIFVNGNYTQTIVYEPKDDYPMFVSKKGLTGGGSLKLVFTGDTYYRIKNVCLYNVRFSSEARIPNYSEWCEHEIPKGLYKVNRVFRMLESGVKEYIPFEIMGRKLLLPSYESGCFIAESTFFPEMVSKDTPNDTEIDVPVDVEYVIITKACALLSQDADYAEFVADAEQGMMMLEQGFGKSGIIAKKAGGGRWDI